jgi:hypothetical protein
MKLYRQGDVLIRRITTVPADTTAIPREGGRIVLAHGEVTGHAHAIAESTASFVVHNETLRRYLKVDKAVCLDHEEHDPIRLPRGNYEITIQKEYRPMDVRNVAD